jgi:adenylosuccinate synthase
MINKIFAVIGANYGDEGKGMYVDHICGTCIPNEVLIVLCNGGAQRAHTVAYPKVTNKYEEGIRHVYHHFGSGTLLGSSTYFTEDFILNPIIFVQELSELIIQGEQLHKKIPTFFYADSNCKISSPFDMILNQIQRENDKLNNSCGIGIWETINRYESDNGVNFTLEQAKNLFDKSPENINVICEELRNLFFNEIKSRGLEFTNTWSEIIDNDNLIKNYIQDLQIMVNRLKLINDDNFTDCFSKYRFLLFEMGQGLLLDKDIEDIKFSTSSNTGMKNIIKILPKFSSLINSGPARFEVNYITRWCLTRHGSGPFNSFDKESELYKYLSNNEKTNVYNIHQGEFQFGELDSDNLIKRVQEDYNNLIQFESLKIPQFLKHSDSELQLKINGVSITSSMKAVITHMDEYEDLEDKGLIITETYSHIRHINSNIGAKYIYGPMGKGIF